MAYEIGNRIRKYREIKKMSQKELAKILNVSNSRISNWESGLNRPDVSILADLCRALNVSPSELLDVRLDADDLTAHEHQLIKAYRIKTDLQHAVNILLGLDET